MLVSSTHSTRINFPWDGIQIFTALLGGAISINVYLVIDASKYSWPFSYENQDHLKLYNQYPNPMTTF